MINKKETNEDQKKPRKDFFFSMGDEKWEHDKSSKFLLSSDTLSWYWLDLMFKITKKCEFDWIDLAIWKNFDSWNSEYVKELSDKYDLPIKVVQVSSNVNEKEMSKALDICYNTWADTITINAPKIFNLKSYNYILDNINRLKKENKNINFAIINPEDSNLFMLPIPKYRFVNLVEIIKKYSCYLWLDVANMDSNAFENDFMRKLKEFCPYIAVLYLSDKTRLWQWHVAPWEGTLKLPLFLKKLKQYWFRRYISTKINISKSDLSDKDKVELILKKTRKYFIENYENLTDDS